jgi:hypothetical protein
MAVRKEKLLGRHEENAVVFARILGDISFYLRILRQLTARSSVEHMILEPLVRNKIYFNLTTSQLCNIRSEILTISISDMSLIRFVLVISACFRRKELHR